MYKTIEDTVGNTPLVQLQRLRSAPIPSNVLLAKLEGNNPAGSVKDRPALSMIVEAEKRGTIKRGDTLIEATSGNTGIALAMAAAMRGYRMVLVMPEHLSLERRQTMRAFGAEIVLTPKAGGMETARDVAEKMRDEGRGIILDQFANPDNPLAHYRGTGPEIWRDTDGRITHFVSSMGTTGTIMGVSRFLKEKNPQRDTSSAASPTRARRFRASASGRTNTCRRSTTRSVSTASNTSRRRTPKRPRAGSRARRASSRASPPAAPARSRCASRGKSTTRPLSSSSAIAATATCRPACFRPES